MKNLILLLSLILVSFNLYSQEIMSLEDIFKDKDKSAGFRLLNSHKNYAGKVSDIASYSYDVLPKSYTQRTFFGPNASYTYNIDQLPGFLVRYDPYKETYKTASLMRYYKQTPKITLISDGLIYSHKFNRKASFNGSYLIASIKVEDESIIDLNIEDVAVCSLNEDSLYKDKELYDAALMYSDDETRNLFIVKGVTLTVIKYKTFEKISTITGVSGEILAAEAGYFKSNESIYKDVLISLDLMSLYDFKHQYNP
ncbi:MAG: hypothetical protein AB2L26_14130 [Ignavibacteria bacterium]